MQQTQLATTPQELARFAVERGRRTSVKLPLGETTYWFYPASATAVKPETILLVHGYRGNHHGLEAIAGALPEHNILIPDLPGFGESVGFAEKYNISNYAAWVTQLVSALPYRPTLILAHSFGSIIVAAAAASGIALPVVFLNPISSFGRTGAKRVLAALQNGFYRLGGVLPPRAGNALLSWPLAVRLMSIYLAKSKDKNLRRWIHQQHRENFSQYTDRRVLIEGIQAGEEASVADFAPMIAQRVMVIAAEHDDITALADQMRLSTLFANSEFRLLSGVGHLTHYETPAQVAYLVREFIADI